MKKITEEKVLELLEEATEVACYQNKLVIDIKSKRIIINDVSNPNYYVRLYNNTMIHEFEVIDYIYCEKNLKLILEHYPNINKRNWLSETLNLSKEQIRDKYLSMLASFEKNNRYSKQYWKEELEELKNNKNNLKSHAEKYNRSLSYLEVIIKHHNL